MWVTLRVWYPSSVSMERTEEQERPKVAAAEAVPVAMVL
jgi:hypothetical protein